MHVWKAQGPEPLEKPADGNLLLAARNRFATSRLISEADSVLHWPSQPTARRGLRPQVKDQGGAYQTEANARRDESNQHRGGEARKNTE